MDSAPAVESESREVTLEEALSIAVLVQQNGHYADAEEIYRKILDRVPGHPDASHFLGVLLSQRGEHAAAAALIEALVAEHPDHADAWSNLGLTYKAQGRLEAATDALRHAIALNPQHANAHSNLGILLRAQGRNTEAEAAYTRAITIDPTHARAHHNLGALLQGVGRIPEAVVAYNRAYVLDPSHSESKRLLAHAYCVIGERAKAVEVVRSWLAMEPDNPVAAHLLAACSGENVPARTADACVEKMFDDFAGSFDAKLTKLRYRAPELTATVLAQVLPAPDKSLDIADVGCGTGLCGPLLAPFARRLVGVDLSARMLAGARLRGVYDELFKEELTAFLNRHPASFDVVVSADTLVYFGDLIPVFQALAGALRPGGIAAFTLEEGAFEPAAVAGAPGFLLNTHGRYGHFERRVREWLDGVQLEATIVRAELRLEGGKPVAGLVVRARKAAVSRGVT